MSSFLSYYFDRYTKIIYGEKFIETFFSHPEDILNKDNNHIISNYKIHIHLKLEKYRKKPLP